jgi:hypothetical protein
MFDGEELEQMIANADWLTVNSYEFEMLKKKTGLDQAAITARLPGGLIVTHGGDGSELFTAEGKTEIPAVKPERSPTRPAAATPTGPACCWPGKGLGSRRRLPPRLDPGIAQDRPCRPPAPRLQPPPDRRAFRS